MPAVAGLAMALAACDAGQGASPADSAAPNGQQPPQLLNEELPVRYPGTLWARGVGGEVTLRLYVDSTGAVVPDSTSVERSSGEPQLDSAALRGVPEMRFSPAMRNGRPVGATLLVPVVFSRDTVAAPSDSATAADSGAAGR